MHDAGCTAAVESWWSVSIFSVCVHIDNHRRRAPDTERPTETKPSVVYPAILAVVAQCHRSSPSLCCSAHSATAQQPEAPFTSCRSPFLLWHPPPAGNPHVDSPAHFFGESAIGESKIRDALFVRRCRWCVMTPVSTPRTHDPMQQGTSPEYRGHESGMLCTPNLAARSVSSPSRKKKKTPYFLPTALGSSVAQQVTRRSSHFL